MLRASHQSRPSRLLHDPYAPQLLPGPLVRWLVRTRWIPRVIDTIDPVIIDQLASRDRFADEWALSGKDHITQLVLLGSGLDTMSWRLDEAMPHARFFELDLSTMLEYKQRRLRWGGPLPTLSRCTTVPIDFEQDHLGDVLQAAGFDTQQATFVNWMGVSYFLPLEVVDGVFATLRDLTPPGSIVAFDYQRTGGPADTKKVRRFLTRVGEPFKTFFHEEEIPKLAERNGFSVAAQIPAHVCVARCQGTAAPWMSHISLAAFRRRDD